MAFEPTWKRGLRITREATWGTTPTAGNYNEGGKTFSILTTSAPGSLQPNAPHIIPMGQVGKRSMHQYAPVPGRRRAEGSLDIPFASDTGGLLLAAAIGGVSTVLTADAGNPLKASGAIGASPATIGSITAPANGAFLAFVIASATGGSGSIAVAGVTADGETVTETVAVSGNGTFYTQRSYASITGNQVVVTHTLTGSPTITVNGYLKATHTISQSDSNFSLTIEEHGDPSAGSGNAWFYKGSLIRNLGIAFDAADQQGLLVLSADFVGKYPVAATKTTFQQPVHVPFPAWTAAITRDGSSYNRVRSFNATYATGSDVVDTANGTQDPQGPFYGSRSLTGQVTFALEGSQEYDDWEDIVVRDFAIVFTTPFNLSVDTTAYHALTLDLAQVYLTNFTPGDDNGLATATFDFYTRDDATDGILEATLVNAVASYA